MRNKTGLGKPGVRTHKNNPHLGDLLLEKLGKRVSTGFDDLEKFELVDCLEKPVLNFSFYGNKRIILDLYDFLDQTPYAFMIRTKKGDDIWGLPERGVRRADVHISRFPKLIKFIRNCENAIPDDLWGLLYGYPLSEIHQFTYDWDEWSKKIRKNPRCK